MAGPLVAGHGIPGDADRLAGFEAAEIGLVDEDADLYASQIRDLREFLTDGNVIAGAHGKRIERSVHGRNDGGGADFVLERANGLGILLHVEVQTLNVETGLRIELRFLLLQRSEIGARVFEVERILIELGLGCGLLGEEIAERFLQLLETLHTPFGGADLALQISHLIGRATRMGALEERLRGEQILADGGELRLDVGIVEAQYFFAAMDGLAFFRADFGDVRWKLRAENECVDRLDFAVAGDRGLEIVASDAHNLNIWRPIARGDDDDDENDQNEKRAEQ